MAKSAIAPEFKKDSISSNISRVELLFLLSLMYSHTVIHLACFGRDAQYFGGNGNQPDKNCHQFSHTDSIWGKGKRHDRSRETVNRGTVTLSVRLYFLNF